VLAATVLDEPSSRPADLDLRALWRELRSQFAGRPSHTIRLSCDPARYELALTLLAGQGAGPPRVLDAGPPVVFEVEVHVLRPAVGLLAALGTGVRALAPPELREMVVAVAEELLGTYSGGGSAVRPAPPLT
jgi:hypothetical protein